MLLTNVLQVRLRKCDNAQRVLYSVTYKSCSTLVETVVILLPTVSTTDHGSSLSAVAANIYFAALATSATLEHMIYQTWLYTHLPLVIGLTTTGLGRTVHRRLLLTSPTLYFNIKPQFFLHFREWHLFAQLLMG